MRSLEGLKRTGVMHLGRTYILYIKHMETRSGCAILWLIKLFCCVEQID